MSTPTPRDFTVGYGLGYNAAADSTASPDDLRGLANSAFARWNAGQTNYAPPDGPTAAPDEAEIVRRTSALRLAADELARIKAAGRPTLTGPAGLFVDSGRVSADEALRVADWILTKPTEAEPFVPTESVMAWDHAEPVGTFLAREQYGALRHLATVANDLFVDSGRAFAEDASDGEDASTVDLALIAKLDDAVDQAYKALDWPRYPEATP